MTTNFERVPTVTGNVSVESNSEVGPLERHVRSSSDSRHRQVVSVRPLRANSGLSASQQNVAYSISSSAMLSKSEEMVRPSALAVFMLMTSSNLVGCSTGRSAGFLPARI